MTGNDDMYDIKMTRDYLALPDDGIKEALMTLDYKVYFLVNVFYLVPQHK